MSEIKKYKLNNKYDTYYRKKVAKHDKPTMTNREHSDDCDIYKCFEKYGVKSMIEKSMATENMYLDMTGVPLTLDEAIVQKQQMDDYFRQQPAQVRKVFGDNIETFYQKYKNGEFEDFLKTGILSEEQIGKLQDNYDNYNVVTLTQKIKEMEKENARLTNEINERTTENEKPDKMAQNNNGNN